MQKSTKKILVCDKCMLIEHITYYPDTVDVLFIVCPKSELGDKKNGKHISLLIEIIYTYIYIYFFFIIWVYYYIIMDKYFSKHCYFSPSKDLLLAGDSEYVQKPFLVYAHSQPKFRCEYSCMETTDLLTLHFNPLLGKERNPYTPLFDLWSPEVIKGQITRVKHQPRKFSTNQVTKLCLTMYWTSPIDFILSGGWNKCVIFIRV